MPATDDRDYDETRARCELPQMEIDIVHRRTREGDAELIAISLQMFPAAQAFDRLVAMSDPFRFWGQLAEAAWWPWLQGLPTSVARFRQVPSPQIKPS